MSENKKLSIVVPMYNSEKYLKQLFLTLDTASENSTEIILIDDGSTDDTYEKCKHYSAEKNNVRLIHNSNHGVSYSRNCGINCAVGKYVMFVDSDDRLLNGWNEKVADAIASSDGADVIVFSKNVHCNNPDKKEIICAIMGVNSNFNIPYLGSPCSKLFKRSFLREKKIEFNSNIINGEDAIFNIEAVLKAKECSFYCNSIYSYYINGNSATHKYDAKFLRSNKCYLQSIEVMTKKSGLFAENEIEEILSFLFANSVYIYAGRVSKLENKKNRCSAIKEFYQDEFCLQKMNAITGNRSLPIYKQAIYMLVRKHGFYILESVLPLIPRKKVPPQGYWIDI